MEEIVKQAIVQKRLIEFYYYGLHRIAEPHVLGISGGIAQVLVYQVGGQSSSGKLPNWRRVDLHEMSCLHILNQTFPGKRPFTSGRHSSWDIHLATVG